MPAEWETHEATWLTWPRNKITWPGTMLREVENIYLRMIEALAVGETVHLIVRDEKTAASVLKRLKLKAPRLVFHEVAAVDTWIRDYGPIFVKDPHGRKAFTKWTFNAWGGKYKDLARDNGVVDQLEWLRRTPRFDVPMVLEGGSIDMNGRGTCLTTEQCLLNKNRNPKLSRKDIERRLSERFGLTKVIWLKEGIEGDDTDGHIDDITRFSGPNTVLTAVEPDASDANHAILDENLRILRRETDQSGRRLRILELPMPGRVSLGKSRGRLPASYANFYIGNKVVLAPVYSHANDKKAVRILRKAFPGRRIVPIECTPLVYGLGSIHCVTQQEPA